MPTKQQVPVAEGLFTWPSDAPQLIGSRCANCGVMTFPVQSDCPRCYGADMKEALFDRRGTLWTFTTQGFVPKSPPYAIEVDASEFEPFALGYVEFADQAKVEGRIVGCDPAELQIGMEMEVVVFPFMEDSDGNEVVTFAFKPTASEGA